MSGKSARSVSVEAKKGTGYVHSILKEGKDPTIDNLIAVCRAANVTLPWVLYGFEITPAVHELVSELESADPERRAAALLLLRREANATQQPPLADDPR